MEIKFGKLQQMKAKTLASQGANVQNIQINISKAENIFEEYKNYQAQLSTAQDNGGSTVSTATSAFGSTSMSVGELEAKMAEAEEKFAQYYAIVNESNANNTDNNSKNAENKDEKNKVKPKEFGSFMA